MNKEMRDKKGRFVKGNSGFWTGKKRPDMFGHTFNNGRVPWNKGLTKDNDKRVAQYASTISGENNCKWKGDDAGYQSIHKYIRKTYGKPTKCEKCGATKNIHWANKSGNYIRSDRNDWTQLCCSCHRYHDIALGHCAIKEFNKKRNAK